MYATSHFLKNLEGKNIYQVNKLSYQTPGLDILEVRGYGGMSIINLSSSKFYKLFWYILKVPYLAHLLSIEGNFWPSQVGTNQTFLFWTNLFIQF